MTHFVYVNHHPYEVDTNSVGAIENLVLEAVQAGGAFIDFPVSAGRAARVLVTPASAVRIERAPNPIATSPHEDTSANFIAYDPHAFPLHNGG